MVSLGSTGGTIGLVFLEAENFFLFFLSSAKPCAIPCSSLCELLCPVGPPSKLGLESDTLTEQLSSEAGLLLWERERRPPSPLASRQLLHTESSDLERPISRETLPVLAASIRVPHRRLWEWLRFRFNL